MKTSSIESSQITTTSSKPVHFWKKPEFKIAAGVIMTLVGLGVLTLGLTGVIPILPALIPAGVLLSVAAVVLTVGAIHLHKHRMAVSQSRKHSTDLSYVEKEEVLPDMPVNVPIPQFESPFQIDLSVGLTPEQAKAAHELHVAVRSMVRLGREFWILCDKNKVALQEDLKVRILSTNSHSVTKDLVYTSRFFPGVVFKSRPETLAKEFVKNTAVAQKIVQDNNLNLLRIPTSIFLEGMTVDDLSPDSEPWGLVVQEEFTQAPDGQGLLPLNLEGKKDRVKSRIPAFCEFIKFMKLAFYSCDPDDCLILKTPSSEEGSIIGLLKLDSLEGPRDDYANLEPLEDLLITWMTTRGLLRNMSQLGLADEVAKACYEACPTERLKFYLDI